MKINVLDKNNKNVGATDLPKEFFGVKVKPALFHQALIAQMSNARQVIADTKDRSEARGGGAKPWRQKGTGRARHGSRRSPIWKGGGVTFGPTKFRSFKKNINRKMKKAAIAMALSGKARENELIVLDGVDLNFPKTKDMRAIVDSVVPNAASALMVIPDKNEAVRRAGRNIPNIKIINLNNINALDIAKHRYLVFTKETLEAFKK